MSSISRFLIRWVLAFLFLILIGIALAGADCLIGLLFPVYGKFVWPVCFFLAISAAVALVWEELMK